MILPLMSANVLLHLGVTSLVGLPLLLLVWCVLDRPSPKIYWKFFHAFWSVRVDSGGGSSPDVYRTRWCPTLYWLPSLYLPVFFSSLMFMAVSTNLHYPLLINNVGCTLFQVGLIDAGSDCISTVVDLMLKKPLKKLSRSMIFLLSGAAIALGYIVIIGCLLRFETDVATGKVRKWLAMTLALLGHSIAKLNMATQEFAVMRNDARTDMVAYADEVSPGKFALSIGSAGIGPMLTSTQTVLKYPATLAATAIFNPMVSSDSTFLAYAIAGVIGVVLSVLVAIAWQGHDYNNRNRLLTRGETAAPMRYDSGWMANLSPDGRYFRLMFEVGVYDAVAQIVTSGFPRILNLSVLQSALSEDDLGTLLGTVFGISALFFWLSDTSDHHVLMSQRSTAPRSSQAIKKKAAVVSFILLGLGHYGMGQATSFSKPFAPMLVACLFFGLGQATSAGLRTDRKDEIRECIRQDGHSADFERFFMRILGTIGTTSKIINSLLVGVIGQWYGMDRASIAYAFLAGCGVIWSFILKDDLTEGLQPGATRAATGESLNCPLTG